MAEATRTATFVCFKAGGIKGVVATVSSFTTGDTCTFTSGDNGMTTLVWRHVHSATNDATISNTFAGSTLTFQATGGVTHIFAIGF